MDNSIQSQLSFLNDFQKEIEVEKLQLIEKGLKSSNPKDILFANKVLREDQNTQKSFLFDPLNTREYNGYRERPLDISFSTLRRMANTTTIVSSIVTTRKEQIAAYCNYSKEVIQPGWKIEKNIENYFGDLEEYKNSQKLSEEEKQEVKQLISFIENCGVKKRLYHGDDFESFLRKYTEDSLILDQACFEIVPTKLYKPYEFFAVDGATFRFASTIPSDKMGEIAERGYLPYAVQLYQGSVYNYFYPWELAFCIRNQSSNIYLNGYGISEMEKLIRIITWILYAEGYNGKFFSQGSNPKGMFVAKGSISDDKLNELKQTWRAQVSGVDNAWKIPILSGNTELSWIDMQKTNSDMEFYKWLEYLIRLTCAVFKIDPKELGFNLDSDSGINYEGSIQAKLTYSKEKGLVPLLKTIEKNINKYIIFPLSNHKYKFKFTGIDDTDQLILNYDLNKVDKGVMSWKEFRDKYNLPNTLDEEDFLLNSTWIQIQQLKQQQNQGQSQNAEFSQSSSENYSGGNGENGEFGITPQSEEILKQNVFQDFSSSNPFVADLDKFVKDNFTN